MSEILKKLEKVKDLPTLPTIMEQLSAKLRDPNSGMGDIAKVIENDPAMMTRILKMANSPLFSTGNPITSLQMAMTRMGIKAIKNIAMATSVFTAFKAKPGEQVFDRDAFWRHSIAVGTAMNVVYQSYKPAFQSRFDRDYLHLAGLIHDIGKLVFDQYFNDDYRQALALSTDMRIALLESERTTFQLGHNEVGAWLAQKWKLSEDLLSVILHHHQPEQTLEMYYDLVEISYYANALCNKGGQAMNMGYGGNPADPDFSPANGCRLRIEPAQVPMLLENIQVAMQETDMAQLLG